MKNLLSRTGTANPLIRSAHIVPTEALSVPLDDPTPALDDLVDQAAKQRPDLQQAGYEITNSEIQLRATRNQLCPNWIWWAWPRIMV